MIKYVNLSSRTLPQVSEVVYGLPTCRVFTNFWGRFQTTIVTSHGPGEDRNRSQSLRRHPLYPPETMEHKKRH